MFLLVLVLYYTVVFLCLIFTQVITHRMGEGGLRLALSFLSISVFFTASLTCYNNKQKTLLITSAILIVKMALYLVIGRHVLYSGECTTVFSYNSATCTCPVITLLLHTCVTQACVCYAFIIIDKFNLYNGE